MAATASPSPTGTRPVRLGVLGCGIVGSALVEICQRRGDGIGRRTGLVPVVHRVAVRNLARERPVELPPGVLTHDAVEVVTDPEVDVVVELIGGIEPARSLILKALERSVPVVTANKELIANCAEELFSTARAAGVDLLFEAAVAGAIPLMRPLRESLAGEEIRRVMGIVNGTTNYILTRMSSDGSPYTDALAEAQRLGYAERDPTADVEGFDAAAKAAILAMVAFGTRVVAGDVYREGISTITPDDIAMAHRLGYEVKLLAIAEADADGRVSARVHPAMLPADHPLAAVRGSFNAVFVEGADCGELMFYGRGAGGHPTASAVLGDVLDAAANRRRGGHGPVPILREAPLRHIDELASEFYVSLTVTDRPGVLATVADVFGRHGVSIRSMEQLDPRGDRARLVFITHTAGESALQRCLGELRGLPVVHEVGTVLRVVGEEDSGA